MFHKAFIPVGSVECFLAERPELSHIKVRVRGNVLTLESIEEGITYPHARFKRISVHKYMLEMPVKTRWECTFIEGTVDELLEILVEKFPWCLASR